jgi:hypothetical protein
MVFSEDAVGLETHLHHQLADRRLNLVNTRREFFRARPAKVRDILTRLNASITTWIDESEALEWRQSEQTRRRQNTPTPSRPRTQTEPQRQEILTKSPAPVFPPSHGQ